MPEHMKYRISLFGRPKIIADREEDETLRKKCRAIVFLLASGGVAVSRIRLQNIFWPNSNSNSAKHNLNMHLYEIRKRFPGMIVSEDEFIRLSDDVSVDMSYVDMSGLVSADDIARLKTVSGYADSSFLDGFDLPGSPEFFDWKTEQESAYAKIITTALLELASLYSSRGDHSGAVATLETALKLDPLQEPLYRQIMLAYGSMNNTLKVRQVYERLQQVLNDDLDVSPSSETADLFISLIKKTDDRSAQPAKADAADGPVLLPDIRYHVVGDDVPFVGRSDEMEKVLSILGSGEKNLIIIEAAAGVGKTRFLEEVLARQQGISVIFRFYDTDPSFHAGDTCSALAALFTPSWRSFYPNVKRIVPSTSWEHLRYLMPAVDPDSRTPSPAPSDTEALKSLLDFLVALSKFTSVSVGFDDLQSLPDSYITLINDLVLQARYNSISVLATKKEKKLRSIIGKALQRFSIKNILYTVKLDPLPLDAMSAFTSGLGPDAAAYAMEWMELYAPGNPWNMRELVRYLKEEQPVLGCARDIPPLIPPNVSLYLTYTLSVLSDDSRKFVNVASCCGVSFDFGIVSGVCGLSIDKALDALDELINTRYIVQEGPLYRFHLPILAYASYSGLSPSRISYYTAAIEAEKARSRGASDI